MRNSNQIVGSSFCVLLVLLMNAPRVVGIAIFVVVTVLGVYVRMRYRRNP
jgi:hypothetical protein